MKTVALFSLIVVISLFFTGCPGLTTTPNNNIELDNSFGDDGVVGNGEHVTN